MMGKQLSYMPRGLRTLIIAVLAVLLAPAGPTFAQAVATDPGYVLGPGDQIEVSLRGQPAFEKVAARIRTDGTIALTHLADFRVAGETSVTLAARIGKALSDGGFYVNPIVNVEILGYASRYVIVLGEVTQPGLQSVDRSYRVSEIIARAGGIRASGADRVIVNRGSGEQQVLDFATLATGSGAADPLVGPGDKIFVPVAPTFFIYGQVNAPGEYPMKTVMTLRKALARGGGLTAMGSEGRVSVFRAGAKQAIAADGVLADGDVVVVGERLF
jgi:polysaccharide biosynthesis/export protein